MMNYKETLFFIGKCLTISHEEHNFNIVSEQIKSNKVHWDNVVKVATSHYVFPALYCNLKRKKLTQHLPSDLVEYMKHITDLNRERNFQIIEQAKEINELLLVNNITPIFLKGTGNLLEGLYEDIAERMVGDIDFLVKKKDFNSSVKILKEFGYKKHDPNYISSPFSKHYPKMIFDSRISSIEVHRNLVKKPYSKTFNYNFFSKKFQIKDKIKFLNVENKIVYTCFNKYIEDKLYWLKSYNLRAAYDLFLLSKSKNPLKSINNYGFHQKLLNNILSVNNQLLSSNLIKYDKNISSKIYILKFNLVNSKINYKLNSLFWRNYLLLKERIILLRKATIDKEYRKYLVLKTKKKLGF